MARALNANEFLNKQFQVLPFTASWLKHLRRTGEQFSMIIYGKSGQRQKQNCASCSRNTSPFGRVLYNSFEQGYSKSLQDAIRRQRS